MGSPTLPPLVWVLPLNILPFKKVPVVKITFFADISPFALVKTPSTLLLLTSKSMTSSSIIVIGVFLKICWTASL